MKYGLTDPSTAYSAGTSSYSSLSRQDSSLNLMIVIFISFLTHLLIVGLIALVMFLAQLFHWKFFMFDPLELKKDTEFVLVQNPTAPPRDRHTKNRAEHATRSGGQKVPRQAQAEPQRAAGRPASKPQPQPARPQAPSRPRVAPQKVQTPARAVAPTRQQPSNNPPPPAPAPKMPTPTAPSKAPAPAPAPGVPHIKMPSLPAPRSILMGPVSTSPSTGSGTSSGGARGPSQIPGALSGGGAHNPTSGYGRPGGTGGSGGRGTYDQNGSPGGGGGRPGVDALPAPDYGAYMAELQRRIKRNWHPPQAQEDKRVMVLFTISRDGRLLSLRVQRSSGYPEADGAALNAVRASAPFRPLPAGHKGNDLDVQFTFDYNVFSGRRY